MERVSWLSLPFVVVLTRVLLAVVFLASASGKPRDPHRFVSIALSYKVLPVRWARIYALALPWIELALGLMLLLGLGTRMAAALGGLLFFSFFLAVGLNVARGRTELDCGCFGVGRRQKIGVKTLLRDVILLLLSLQVALWSEGTLALDGWLSRGVGLTGNDALVQSVLPLVLVVVGVIMISQLLRQMARLLRNGGQL